MMTKAAGAAVVRHGATAVAFLLLAVLLTWPLASHLATHVPGGGYGDNLTFVWNFWWMRHALASGTDAAFYSTYLFYPTGIDLTLHTHTALGAFLGATAFRVLSIVAALNVVILLSVALNGFCAYLLAWRLTRDRSGALLAGLFFAASPYFSGRLHGHFNLVGAWCLPAFWLLFSRALVERSWRLAIAAGAVFAAAAYTDYYYTVYAAVLMLCLLGAHWLHVRVRRASPSPVRTTLDLTLLGGVIAIAGAALLIALSGGTVLTLFGHQVSLTSGYNLRPVAWILFLIWLWRRWRPAVRVSWAASPDLAGDLRTAGIVVAVFAIAASPLLQGAWEMWQRGDYISHTYFWRSAPGGIDVAALFTGSPFHPLWGEAVRRLHALGDIHPFESLAWFGVAPILFLVATRSAWLHWPDARSVVTVAAVFFLWALGPFLFVFGWNTGLYLPEILLRYLPIVANARIPGRAIVMVYLAAALWLAMAVASRPQARRGTLAGLLGLAILADFIAVPLPLVPLDDPPIYRQLAAMPAGAVIELPLGIRDALGEEGALDHRTLYYQSIHGKPMVGGFVGRLSARIKAEYHESVFLQTLLDLSSTKEVPEPVLANSRTAGETYLRQYGIRYVVLNTRLASPALQKYVASLPWLRLAQSDAERQLYVIQ